MLPAHLTISYVETSPDLEAVMQRTVNSEDRGQRDRTRTAAAKHRSLALRTARRNKYAPAVTS